MLCHWACLTVIIEGESLGNEERGGDTIEDEYESE